ncbi:MAG: hypothetical protein FIB08_03515 [Candidatus Methanoperedens sp.]|nr:hypothetical protein [Candidatus Methanoperedens sp.]
MQKKDLWSLYQWVRKRLTEKERKLIESTKPNLLVATERELAIQLKSKMVLIMEIIGDSASLDYLEHNNRDSKKNT